jgi:hypothetical protein
MFKSKGVSMKGSIRAAVGFLIVFGVVGGLDTNSISISYAIALAIVGLAIMASGVSAIVSN